MNYFIIVLYPDDQEAEQKYINERTQPPTRVNDMQSKIKARFTFKLEESLKRNGRYLGGETVYVHWLIPKPHNPVLTKSKANSSFLKTV